MDRGDMVEGGGKGSGVEKYYSSWRKCLNPVPVMRLVEVSEVPQPRPLIRGPLKRNAWVRCVYTDMCMSMAGSDGWSRGGFP